MKRDIPSGYSETLSSGINQIENPSLHEYYENKTWTWDTMKSVFDSAAPSLREGEVVLEAHGGYFLNSLFMSNGFDFVTMVDGEPVFDPTAQEALDSIEFLKELMTLGDKIELGSDTDDRWEYTTFISGKALTVLTTAQSVTTEDVAYESDFEYSIMPFPSGPDGNYAVHMNQIKQPSQKFFRTDAARYTKSISGDQPGTINMESYTIFQKQSWPFRPKGYVHIEFRHNARANWVYFDGHCGTRVLEEFLPNTATTPISVYRHMYPKSNTK